MAETTFAPIVVQQDGSNTKTRLTRSPFGEGVVFSISGWQYASTIVTEKGKSPRLGRSIPVLTTSIKHVVTPEEAAAIKAWNDSHAAEIAAGTMVVAVAPEFETLNLNMLLNPKQDILGKDVELVGDATKVLIDAYHANVALPSDKATFDTIVAAVSGKSIKVKRVAYRDRGTNGEFTNSRVDLYFA